MATKKEFSYEEKKRIVFRDYRIFNDYQNVLDMNATEAEIEVLDKLYNSDLSEWNIDSYKTAADVMLRNFMNILYTDEMSDEEYMTILDFIVDTLGGIYYAYADDKFDVEIGNSLIHQCGMMMAINIAFDIMTEVPDGFGEW